MVQRILGPMVLVYGLGEQSQLPAFWKPYHDVLADLPVAALERASKAHFEQSKFFPKPAELKALADPHAYAMRQAASRAKAAAKYEPPKNYRESRTPEDMEAVRKMMDSFVSVVAEKTPARNPMKAVHGPVDEKGVTAAGRALIERMRQA